MWVGGSSSVSGFGDEVLSFRKKLASFLVAEGSPGAGRAPGCAVRGPSPPLARSRSGT